MLEDESMPEEMQREIESLVEMFPARETVITCVVVAALILFVAAMLTLWLVYFGVGQ